MNSDPGLSGAELDELERFILFDLSQPALDAGNTTEGNAYLKVAEIIHHKRITAIQNLKATSPENN